MKPKSDRVYRLVVIAGCGLIGTCLGLGVNVAGLFFSPIATEFGVGRGSVAATLTVYNLVVAFTGMAAAGFVNRFGLKNTVLGGTIIQATATFLLSLSPNVTVLLLLNGVRGFAAGLIGTVLVTVMINNWFNKNNALMISIAMGFSGLAGAILSPLLSRLITDYGWRTGYAVVAALGVVFNLPAILFPITIKPENKNLEPYGGIPETDETERNTAQAKTVSVVPLIILMIFTACSASATALPQHFSGIAESYGMLSTGALMVSACMIANTAGKILLGAMIDRFGARASVSIFAIIIACSAGMLVISRSPAVLIASAAMFGLCYSLATVATAALTRVVFGSENYSRVYPKLALTTTISNALFTSVVGFLYDFSGSYSSVILFLGGMVVAAFIMVHLVFVKKA